MGDIIGYRQLEIMMIILVSFVYCFGLVTPSPTTQGLRCYVCSSYMEQCGASGVRDSASRTIHQQSCRSKCFVRQGEDGAIYRGCYDDFHDVPYLTSAYDGCREQYWNGQSRTWCFCSDNFCNKVSIETLGGKTVNTEKNKVENRRNTIAKEGDPSGTAFGFQNGGNYVMEAGSQYGGNYVYNPMSDYSNYIYESPDYKDFYSGYFQEYPYIYDASDSKVKKESNNQATGADYKQQSQPQPFDNRSPNTQESQNEVIYPHYDAAPDKSSQDVEFLKQTMQYAPYYDYNNYENFQGASEVDNNDLHEDEPSISPELAGRIECAHTGFYQNPSDCRTFVACVLDAHARKPILHLMRCPPGLVWDNRNKLCNQYSSTCSTGEHPSSREDKIRRN